MKRLFVLFTMLFGLALPMWSQTSAVTATITDSDTQTWNNGTYNITFVPLPGTPANSYRINGNPFTQSFTGTLSGAGVLTVTLTDTSLMTPQGGQWNFNICPNASAACGTIVTTVVGATPNLSTVLSSGIKAPRFAAGQGAYGYADVEVSANPLPGGTYFNVISNTTRVWNGTAWTAGGGGGSGTSPTQPAFLVTAAPYNAKCDGSTDDTTAIQAAINAAGTASPRGGTVIFPAGQCNISAALTISGFSHPVNVTGQGWQSTVINQTTTNADGIDITGTAPMPVQLHDLIITQPGFTGTPRGLSITSCSNCKFDWIQVFAFQTNFFITGGANNYFTHLTSVGTTTTGLTVSGTTNSLMILGLLITGTHTTGMAFSGTALDTFVYELQTTAGVNTGLSINGIGASDIHFINPILDSCGSNCININNSNAGALGSANNIQIVDCWCNSSTAVVSPVLITNSDGVHISSGVFEARNTSAAVGVIQVAATSNRISIVNAKVINANTGSTGNNVGINLGGTNDSSIVGNSIFAPTGNTFSAGIQLATTSTNNTVTGNTISGFGTNGIVIDATSVKNVLSGNIVDMTNWTSATNDSAGGNSYASSTLASGISGSATSMKATASITGAVPVKLDTGNANQVVVTTTTDTGGGIPIGVCPNSPGAGVSCLVMTSGLVPLTLGTGTCAVGNFVIVDTTTNGRVQCTGTYTAGTVIGKAQAADSTVGTAFNVQLGLR